MSDPLERVIHYHDSTKHHFHRYARSAGEMDWSTQPDPFRRYLGAPLILLDRAGSKTSPPYDAIFKPDGLAPAGVDAASLAQFFRDSMAVSAWKSYGGERWALRVNPSSGNLHPTESYLVSGPIEGLHSSAAVYHYAPKQHALELRHEIDPGAWERFIRHFPPGSFLVGLTSVHWREAWKYGERAFRYCQHDAGHALGTLRISAAILGWKLRLVENWGDDEIARLLGIEKQSGPESEHPDCVAVLCPSQNSGGAGWPDAEAIENVSRGEWLGEPNVLSPAHVEWEIIDEVTAAARKPVDSDGDEPSSRSAGAIHPENETERVRESSARDIIHQRRSAVAMDGKTSLEKGDFCRMLMRAMPSHDVCPFDVLPWTPAIDLFLFVHRVESLTPGLYFLLRESSRLSAIKSAARSAFIWKRPAGIPPELPLYLLEEGDARSAATALSCGQDIAGDGAFSLGMIAEFEPSLRRRGPWFYRRLFWECGIIGQVLYLEAEAAGVQATGIGCYFDDPVHELLGLRDRQFQSLYHFTVGGAVTDGRLTTLPPYESP